MLGSRRKSPRDRVQVSGPTEMHSEGVDYIEWREGRQHPTVRTLLFSAVLSLIQELVKASVRLLLQRFLFIPSSRCRSHDCCDHSAHIFHIDVRKSGVNEQHEARFP